MNDDNPLLSFISQYSEQKTQQSPVPPEKEYTIDQLASAANTTTRNIRAYQERGILPPPVLRGRKGVYSNAHYCRLKLIADLLDRGHTLTCISELLKALEEGMDLRAFIGLESALTSPWTDESPIAMPLTELMDLFGNQFNISDVGQALELELIRFDEDGETVHVRSMRTMNAGAELVKTGIPFDNLLNIIGMLRNNVEQVADELVKLVSTHVLNPVEENKLPVEEDLTNIADLIWRLRPLAEMAVHAEVAKAMEKSANHLLGDKFESLIEGLEKTNENE